jgi:hypothetical protein
MIKKLESENLASVGAMTLAVWKYGPRVSGTWAYKSTFGYVNAEPDPVLRVRRHTNNGSLPVTSFLTSNVTHTCIVREILNLYSKSPVVATDAISTLLVCASGNFTYLNELYWIRNWNQLPQSHAGWNRNLLVHDWWKKKIDNIELREFENELRNSFSVYGKELNFEESWRMILSSSECVSVKATEALVNSSNAFVTKYINYLKFLHNKAVNPRNLPPDFRRVLSQMQKNEIQVNVEEVQQAVAIVSKLYPYSKW